MPRYPTSLTPEDQDWLLHWLSQPPRSRDST
jgi:hypothetical protein